MQPKNRLNPWRRFQRRFRPLRNFMLIATMEGIRWIAGRLPHRLLLRAGSLLGGLAARIDSRSRRQALDQLARAGVGGDEAGRRRICEGVFREIAMNALESLHSLRWTPEQFRRQVQAGDMSTFHDTRALGRGMILVTGHMGNWELLPRVHHAYTGQVMAAVMADAKDPQLTRWLVRRREAGGQTRILLASNALAMMRQLHRKQTLSLLVDQDSTRSRGIFVDFFGRPAYTPAGPAQLARRTGAPLLPVGIVRDPDQPTRHRILIARPILPDPALKEEADVYRMTQAYTRVLEDWIRRRPEQWVWIHDRWRHQPEKKIRVRSSKRPSD